VVDLSSDRGSNPRASTKQTARRESGGSFVLALLKTENGHRRDVEREARDATSPERNPA
jgi:hypothetical protein